MQVLRSAARRVAQLEASRAQVPCLTEWHATSLACWGKSSSSATFLQHQIRGITQQPLMSVNERVVILGTGWAAMRLAKDLDCSSYDITIVSPRNHMVYTPLLTSACVGTLDFRSVAVPIIALQKHLTDAQNHHYLASAQSIDSKNKEVSCKDEDGLEFKLKYDKLVIATGSQGSTFGIPGVDKYSHPLRDISDANSIKNQLVANWSKANTPNRSAQERQKMLSVLVVGGGPTGVEFAGELSDLINQDLRRVDPERAADMRITLIEAAQLLGTFDEPLREYAASKLHKQGVHLMKAMVKELKEDEAILSNGEVLPYGIAVWSTGVGPTKFTTGLSFAKTARGRIAIDGELRVLQHIKPDHAKHTEVHKPADVKTELEEHGSGDDKDTYQQVDSCWALGDCSANMEVPLPALAQVAEQQGKYLAKQFNALAKDRNAEMKPFVYKHLGSMASIGGSSALIQLGDKGKHVRLKGLKSFLAWRSAYLTRLGSVPNRLYVLMNWTTTFLFGRDMSKW